MQEAQLQIQVPDDMQCGVYANLVGVWHTPTEFTLDFMVMLPGGMGEDGTPVVPARVVSRVKLPRPQIFELMKALSANLAKYEAAFGPIEQPGQDNPLFPPDEPPA